MELELKKILDDVAKGLVSSDNALTTIEGIIKKTELDVYSVLAKENNLIEIRPNVWMKEGSPKLSEEDGGLEHQYTLTKLGFVSKVNYIPPKRKWFFFWNGLSVIGIKKRRVVKIS